MTEQVTAVRSHYSEEELRRFLREHDTPRARLVERHLDNCAKCRVCVQYIKNTVYAFAGLFFAIA